MGVRVTAREARALAAQAAGQGHRPQEPRGRTPRQEPEHDLQVALVQTIKEGRRRVRPDGIEVVEPPLVARHPELAWLFAVPNGGFRHKATARRMAEEGLEPGVPDMLCPCLRLDRHGMIVPGFALELKIWPNRPRPDKDRPGRDQPSWLAAFARQGWWVAVGYDLEAILAWIERFFTETTPVPPIRLARTDTPWTVVRSDPPHPKGKPR